MGRIDVNYCLLDLFIQLNSNETCTMTFVHSQRLEVIPLCNEPKSENIFFTVLVMVLTQLLNKTAGILETMKSILNNYGPAVM